MHTIIEVPDHILPRNQACCPDASLGSSLDRFEPVWTCQHVLFDRALLSHSRRNGDRYVESESGFHRVSALALSTAALARICRGARLQLNEATANVPVPNAAPSVVLSFTLESRCQICQSLSYGPLPPTHFARPASAPAGFSKARNRPTCRCWAPTLFKLGINRKTTDALGADEVIE